MKFKIEIGKPLKNGALCMAVCRFAFDQGVVLANWEGKYVVWSFNTEEEHSTAHGSYFIFDDIQEDGVDNAYENASHEFRYRIENGM